MTTNGDTCLLLWINRGWHEEIIDDELHDPTGAQWTLSEVMMSLSAYPPGFTADWSSRVWRRAVGSSAARLS